MLSETLAEGLAEYRIGHKVRAARLEKKMGLVELGAHTGLSPAMLSKIERGKLFPTLPTLLRIAMVFSVGLDWFFRDDASRPVSIVRRSERRRFPERLGGREVAYRFESLDFRATEQPFRAYLAEFETFDTAEAPAHSHPGAEFLYVLSGQLALRAGDEEHVLAAGDAATLDPAVPHSYRKVGSARCTALVVTAPDV